MSLESRNSYRFRRTISDNLGLTRGGELAPSLPVILVEGVLDGDDGVLGDQVVVVLAELFTGQPLGGVRVGVLSGTNVSTASHLPFVQSLP
jgi:hypothetical protein